MDVEEGWSEAQEEKVEEKKSAGLMSPYSSVVSQGCCWLVGKAIMEIYVVGVCTHTAYPYQTIVGVICMRAEKKRLG